MVACKRGVQLGDAVVGTAGVFGGRLVRGASSGTGASTMLVGACLRARGVGPPVPVAARQHGRPAVCRVPGCTDADLRPHACAGVAVDAPAPRKRLDHIQAKTAAVLHVRGAPRDRAAAPAVLDLQMHRVAPDPGPDTHDRVGRRVGVTDAVGDELGHEQLRVGNRRRVLLADLLAYKRIDDAERRSIADELTSEAQRLGLDY